MSKQEKQPSSEVPVTPQLEAVLKKAVEAALTSQEVTGDLPPKAIKVLSEVVDHLPQPPDDAQSTPSQ